MEACQGCAVDFGTFFYFYLYLFLVMFIFSFLCVCVCLCLFFRLASIFVLSCKYCIGMEMIPAAMKQDPSQMLSLLNMLYIHMPTMMNNPELLHLLNRMRQMDAIRRDEFVQRRYQALLAIGNQSRM